MFKVGKKYRGKLNRSASFKVEFILSDGSAAGLYNSGVSGGKDQPFAIFKDNFSLWEEIKEPVVRYVHLYRGRLNNHPWTVCNVSEKASDTPEYEYIETKRVEFNG